MNSSTPPWEPMPARSPMPPRTMPNDSVAIIFNGPTKSAQLVLTPDMLHNVSDATLGAIFQEMIAGVRK